MTSPARAEVRAAGGVVWRAGDDSQREVVLVHRPSYDDWSFPKGKNDPDECDEDCARREVLEETGLRCELGTQLTDVSYVDRSNHTKVVRYWAMTVVSEQPFVPNREIDAVRWMKVDEVWDMLSYVRDRKVLEAFVAAELP